jgi:acyl-CoA thioester hydrolase
MHVKEPPVPRVFTQDIHIAEPDIDMQGHVNNTRYVAWMQDVAVAHSAAQGWSMERYVAEGAGWVVRQHTITYKRPCFLGETVTACTWIATFSPRQSARKYLFWRAADKAVLAEAETQWVFIDLITGRPTKVPQELRDAFELVEDEAEVKRVLEG